MLGKFKRLFVPLCIVSLVLTASVAQANTVLVCRASHSSKSQSSLDCQNVLPVNTLSFSFDTLVGVATRFSGDLAVNPAVVPQQIPADAMKMNTALGLEGTYVHAFSNQWAVGAGIGISALTLTIPSLPLPDGSSNYYGQMTMNQYAGNFFFGRSILVSDAVKLRVLLSAGLLYYRTTNAWRGTGATTANFVPYSSFGFLYGARLEAILGSWATNVHPILTVSYTRSSPLTLLRLQGSTTNTEEIPVVSKPKFIESVLMFGVGAAFMV